MARVCILKRKETEAVRLVKAMHVDRKRGRERPKKVRECDNE